MKVKCKDGFIREFYYTEIPDPVLTDYNILVIKCFMCKQIITHDTLNPNTRTLMDNHICAQFQKKA